MQTIAYSSQDIHFIHLAQLKKGADESKEVALHRENQLIQQQKFLQNRVVAPLHLFHRAEEPG